MKLSKNIGYTMYLFTLLFFLIRNSALPMSFPPKMLLAIIIFLAFVKVIFQGIYGRFNLKILYFSVLFMCFSVFAARYSGDLTPLTLAIMLFSANDLNMDRLSQITYRTVLVALVLLTGLSILGVIVDYQIFRDGQMRHSFGTTQPTVFSAIVFYGMAAYMYFKRNNLKFHNCLILICIIVFTYYFTISRNDTFAMVLLLCIPLIVRIMKNKYFGWIPKIFVLLAYPFNAIFVYLTSSNYSSNAGIYLGIDLNEILSNRLYFGEVALNSYPIKLFGQYFIMYGNGAGRTFDNLFHDEYFFIDSSYLFILLRYGAVFTLLLLTWLTWRTFKFMQNKLYFLATLMAIIAFESAWQLTLIEYMNVFILCLTISSFQKESQPKLIVESNDKTKKFNTNSVSA